MDPKEPPKVASMPKKPRIPYQFYCPNQKCLKGFKHQKEWRQHVALSKECHMVVCELINSQQMQKFLASQQTGPTTRSAVAKFDPTEQEDIIVEEDVGMDDTVADDTTVGYHVMDSDRELEEKKPTDTGVAYTTPQYHETKLLQLLDEMKAPHSKFQEIMKWAQAAMLDRYNFVPENETRKGRINNLKKWLDYSSVCEPQQITTELPGDPIQYVDVTIFNFTSQLYTLLNDKKLFGDISNLDVDPNNVFGKYKSSKFLSTVNSGNLYKTDSLMPIIFACDETKLKSVGKAGCWPQSSTKR